MISIFKKIHYKTWIIIILTLILLLGSWLRLYHITDESLWIDESISSLASKQILENGIPIFDSGLLYTRALLFHYLTAISLFFFNGELGSRLISVLFGLGTILLSYFIAKEFGINEKNKVITGLFAALLTSVLYFEIIYSRQGRFYQLFQFLFFLTIFFIYKSKKDKKYAWFSCLSLILLVDTHIAGLVLIPFMIFFFIKDHKDIKLLIIPGVLSLYYLSTIFGLNYGSYSLASTYLESYSLSFLSKIKAFIIISIIGIPFAFIKNKRLSLLIILPSIILFFSLIFLKVFALRYAYFIVFAFIIMISAIMSYIHQNSKLLFIFIMVFVIIYPSNLFFEQPITVIKPIETVSSGFTEPVINYKSLSQETKDKIIEKDVVTLFTPGVSFYLKNPEYFIPFSLDGTSNGSAIYDGKDSYTGAEIFNNQVDNFVLLEDSFGYSKLSKTQREYLENIKKSCLLIDQTNSVRVYECS